MSFINYFTRIHFAENVLEDALRVELDGCGARRPMFVTDRAAGAELLDRALSAVPAAVRPEVYDRTPRNPTQAAAVDVAVRYRDAGCDALIAFGSGAAIDLAKAAGIAVSHDGPLLQYTVTEGGTARIRNLLPPILAVPTTAGTGSEVSANATITFDGERKLGIASPHLIPRAAICDPTLTVRQPSGSTAADGMDAISHCIETFIALPYNPPADGIAFDGLRRASANIERAVSGGADIEARREMMAAALNGALAFQKGLGGVHAISHALGGLPGFDLDHGALNAILLPHVLEFNAPAAGHRYPALAEAMRLPGRSDVVAALAGLAGRLGLPSRLRDLGIKAASLDLAAERAEKDHTNGTNPRRATAVDYRAILARAL